MYESLKRAQKNYRNKLKASGIAQHSFFSTQKEFIILKTILKVLKTWDLSDVENLDVDPETMTITLKNRENSTAE